MIQLSAPILDTKPCIGTTQQRRPNPSKCSSVGVMVVSSLHSCKYSFLREREAGKVTGGEEEEKSGEE